MYVLSVREVGSRTCTSRRPLVTKKYPCHEQVLAYGYFAAWVPFRQVPLELFKDTLANEGVGRGRHLSSPRWMQAQWRCVLQILVMRHGKGASE
jgi:hypothetical protein